MLPAKKTIVTVLILSSLAGSVFFTPLHEAQAVITWDIPYLIDNYVIRPLLRKVVNGLENRLLNRIGNIITDKANGGKDPYWITNWRNNILDSNARGVDVFRAVLADTELCPRFGDNLKKIFGAEKYGGLIDGSGNLTFAPGTDPFQVSNRCGVNFDVDAFAKDFTQGGWEAWDELLQPKNNFFGSYFDAISEAEGQISVETQASQDQSVGQAGWKGAKLEGKTTTTKASGCAVKLIDGRCPFFGKTVTPGTILNQSAELRLKQKADQLVNSREIEDMILAILDAVVDKVANQILNLLDGELFAERDYQGPLSAAESARESTKREAAKKLACQQGCQGQSYPECSNPKPVPSGQPVPPSESEKKMCEAAGLARCLAGC